jgi:hypothetical protein
MKFLAVLLAGGFVAGLSGFASAQTTTDVNAEAVKMNSLAATYGETKVVNKISSDFNSFLGSNSTAVISGLRNGTPISLTNSSTNPSTPGTTTTVINPPTGQMGVGNVFISLALAKQQLGAMGITQPTPEQLQAALTDGSITTATGLTSAGTPTTTTNNLEGILTMRSQNMGWGQIAQKLGYKLGPVISGMKQANQSLATTASATAAVSKGNAQSTKSPQNGRVSGGGQSQGNFQKGISSAKGSGSGIVSAAGKVSGSGNAYGHGKSIVTGSGHSASANGVVSNRGNASSHGKGHNK